MMSTNPFEAATNFIEKKLVAPLIHGDKEHQEWLKSELRKWTFDLAELLADFRDAKNEVRGKES